VLSRGDRVCNKGIRAPQRYSRMFFQLVLLVMRGVGDCPKCVDNFVVNHDFVLQLVLALLHVEGIVIFLVVTQDFEEVLHIHSNSVSQVEQTQKQPHKDQLQRVEERSNAYDVVDKPQKYERHQNEFVEEHAHNVQNVFNPKDDLCVDLGASFHDIVRHKTWEEKNHHEVDRG